MKHSEKIRALLQDSNLRITNTRKQVLEQFLEAGNKALSSAVIEQRLDKVDRITLYRTLKTFEEAGLIHEAIDGSGKAKYALCSEHCSTHQHFDQHPHFFCKKCEKTICLEEVALPRITIPSSYQVDDLQMVLSGICRECQK